jgi:hypothetical protein
LVRGLGATVERVPWPPERERIDIGSVYVDHSKALTGWQPNIGLGQGLESTWRSIASTDSTTGE